ncbi:hypothetical protein [Salmonella enterica]|uniref:hypothetical protein n=1 Tax=Salmonella enterica TaxID=28901 RepID=UPI00398C3CFF
MALPLEDESLVLMLSERIRHCGLIPRHHGLLPLPDLYAGLSDVPQAVLQNG